MLADLRTALRGLRASAGTTSLAWSVLVLGVAAATVTFSVVDHVVLRPLPFPDSDRLVAIGRTTPSDPSSGVVAPQDFLAWRARSHAFTDLAAVGLGAPLRMGTAPDLVTLRTFRATSNLFDVLGATPIMGRVWAPDREESGNDAVVAISFGLWQRQFGGDPGIVGRSVAFSRQSREVVAVMPPGFTYPIEPGPPADAWIPLALRPNERDPNTPGRGFSLMPVGRLRPGATVAEARADIEQITAATAAAYRYSGWDKAHVAVLALSDFVVGDAGRWMLLVLGGVAVVLLVAYVNAANLLLARATVRGRELATRAALGASASRLLRTQLFESLILSIAATAGGILIAVWGVGAVRSLLPDGIARADAIGLDARVLLVATVGAVATGIVFGAVPAWQASRIDLVSALKQSGGRTTAGRARWRAVFLVSEIAFVAVLLFATTLFVTSFVRVVRADLGFERSNVMAFAAGRQFPGASRDDLPALTSAYYRDLLDRVSQVPGVEAVAIADGGLPLDRGAVSYSVKPEAGGDEQSVRIHSVSPGFLAAAGLHLQSGRFLDANDRAGGQVVGVLNDVGARRLFPGRDAVGERISFFNQPTTIVGVVQGMRLGGPEIDLQPELYVPVAQGLTEFGDFGIVRLVVRTTEAAPRVAPFVQSAIAPALGATTRPPEPVYLDELFRDLTAGRRFSAGLMTTFGLLALAIGALGVYGVMAFVVAERTRELGVRIALGARRSNIIGLVLRQASVHLAVGLAAGLTAAWLASGIFQSVLFDVQPADPIVTAAVVVVLGSVGLVAALVPALRAARVDPLTALRSE